MKNKNRPRLLYSRNGIEIKTVILKNVFLFIPYPYIKSPFNEKKEKKAKFRLNRKDQTPKCYILIPQRLT